MEKELIVEKQNPITDKRYYHLSNSGVTAEVTQNLGEHPGVAIDLELSTFGCMNASIHLSCHEYAAPFMNSTQILDLSQLFLQAAVYAIEAEQKRVERLEERLNKLPETHPEIVKELGANHPMHKELKRLKARAEEKEQFRQRVSLINEVLKKELEKPKQETSVDGARCSSCEDSCEEESSCS